MSYRAVPFLLLPLLAACAAQPVTRAPAPATAAVPAAPATTAPEPRYRPFPPDTLESLLTAEIAALRQRPDVALSNYLEEARKTRDPNVVARATTIAQVLGQPQSLEMAQLWTEVAPKAPEAWFLLSLNALRQQRFELAMPALDRLLALQPEADLEQLFLAALPTKQEERDQMLQQLQQLSKAHPRNAFLLFGQALLKAQSGKPSEALEIANAAHRLHPDGVQTMLLQAKMLAELNRPKEAASLLGNAVSQHPDSHILRLNLARALVRSGDLNGAEVQFGELLKQLPNDEGLHLSLALVAFDNRHDEIAQRELETLQDSDAYGDEASYFQGLLAERQNRTEAALQAFERVQAGNQYLPALAEISRLLAAGGKLNEARDRLAQARAQTPELQVPLYQLEAELLSDNGQATVAWDLLSKALGQNPDSADLLLSRGMVAEKLNRLDEFEADLQAVLKREPNNPSALNALGYTLVDRTDRIKEAEGYIRRAHELKPDDPAIIDSLGWLKYKKGDSAGALVELRKAYALYPDDEIAAHLGEVLWVLGQHAEARRVWSESLRQHPKSAFIPRTRERLDPTS